MPERWCSHHVEEFGGRVKDIGVADAFIADSNFLAEQRHAFSAMT